MLLRCMRRRRMTWPVPSSPTTLQLFLPRSMPRTAIAMESLPSSESPPASSAEGRAIHKGGAEAGYWPLARRANTKIHALADAKGRLIAVLLTGGQAHDCPVAERLIRRVKPSKCMLGDAAYDSGELREQLIISPKLPQRVNHAVLLSTARCSARTAPMEENREVPGE